MKQSKGRMCRPGLLRHYVPRNDEDYAALRVARKSPIRSSALRMFSVELA
jgi:hypothetical protein